jgi:hypothetical protein
MSLEFTIEIICAVRGAKSATLFGAFLNKKEDFRSEVLFLYPENHSLGEWFKRGCCR